MRLYEVDRPKLDVSSLRTPAVMQLNKAMIRAGHEVRIVGGAVRDLVLGKDPKDIDMATDATPDEMMKIFDQAGIRYEPTGLQHGTLTVILDGEPIEITTLRIDKETDGRHAEVEFTRDWKVDAERRDLTFNAMSVDLDGNLYDYFGGVEDLKILNALNLSAMLVHEWMKIFCVFCATSDSRADLLRPIGMQIHWPLSSKKQLA